MEVIACIPELPHVRTGDDAGPSARGQVAVAATSRADQAGPSTAEVTGAVDDSAAVAQRAVRARAARGRRVTAFPAPSVLILAAVAAAVWAAAWRSERLRAIEQRRPQRVAMEPAAAAARSVLP
jgi:hypothetical protein